MYIFISSSGIEYFGIDGTGWNDFSTGVVAFLTEALKLKLILFKKCHNFKYLKQTFWADKQEYHELNNGYVV